MALIAELCAEHRALEEQARHLLAIVESDIPDTAAVAALRWGLAQMLGDHCAREDYLVYDTLLACGDAVATRIAWAHRQEHGGLRAAFFAYAAAWSVERMAQEWLLFRAETRAIIAQLARRIEQEETALYCEAARIFARRAAA